MAINYAKQFTRPAKTPATTSVYTKVAEHQVQNSCGAFVFTVDDWDRLNRFLILGAEGGTYYVGQRDLVKQNHDVVLRCLKLDGLKAVEMIASTSESGRAYKNDPAVFALALCAAHGSTEVKQAAYKALPRVCRIGTHLFHFMQYATALRGCGSGLRRAVSRWYAMPYERLANQVVKYQSRDGWSHRDLLRLSHPVPEDKAHEAIFRWVVGGMDALGAREIRAKGTRQAAKFASVKRYLPELIAAFEEAKKADTKTLVKLILDHNLPREAVPTEKLNEVAVWDALMQKMPLNAMIRNLGKMTNVGLLKPLSAAANLICKRLADGEYLRKSRVHPMQVLLAAKTYGQGRGIKGTLSWTPVPQVLSALDQAFYDTFPNVRPCGKPLLIGLDVSGSMASEIGGTPLKSSEAVAALSLVHCNVEPACHVFGFASGDGRSWGSTKFKELGIRKGMRLTEATQRCQQPFGSTDVSLAYQYALDNKLSVGGFIVMTDSETNMGAHPTLKLREYRQRFVPDARSVVVATTSTGFTVNDPNDKFGLDVAGFDASVPALIGDFIRGDLGSGATEAEEDTAE